MIYLTKIQKIQLNFSLTTTDLSKVDKNKSTINIHYIFLVSPFLYGGIKLIYVFI